MNIDGWAETNGPSPATIDGISQTAQITRLGAEGRYILAPGEWLWGSLAWAHELEDVGAPVSGELTGLFGLSAPGAPLGQDWMEATVGARHDVGAGGALTAAFTLNTAGSDVPNLSGDIGLSWQF